MGVAESPAQTHRPPHLRTVQPGADGSTGYRGGATAGGKPRGALPLRFPPDLCGVAETYRLHQQIEGTMGIPRLTPEEQIDKIIELALAEDLGQGDITSEILIPIDLVGKAYIL